MKLRHLEMALERLEGFSAPSVQLEQYRTPAPLGARLLYHACMRGDIRGRSVCDLGCGTGVLAIGAALLEARRVAGIDIDPGAVDAAKRNAERLGLSIAFSIADVRSASDTAGGPFDTVVMNPPFGAQKRHADRPFIDAALTIGDAVYAIFNAGSLPFVETYVHGRAIIEETVACSLVLPHTFVHQRRERVEIEALIVCLRRCPS
jgi:putative methylase